VNEPAGVDLASGAVRVVGKGSQFLFW